MVGKDFKARDPMPRKEATLAWADHVLMLLGAMYLKQGSALTTTIGASRRKRLFISYNGSPPRIAVAPSFDRRLHISTRCENRLFSPRVRQDPELMGRARTQLRRCWLFLFHSAPWHRGFRVSRAQHSMVVHRDAALGALLILRCWLWHFVQPEVC